MRLLPTALLVWCASFARGLAAPQVPRTPSPEYVQDAERKHGRVALLALPALAAIATFDPHPVTYLSRQPVDAQLLFFAVAGVAEAASLSRLGPRFTLRVPPGVYPPLRAMPSLDAVENTAGRAAMLAVTALMLAELVA